jgi:rhodanese-related sulfurtransferase
MPTFSTLESIALVAVLAALWFFFMRNRQPALSPERLAELRRNGAQIIDVRSPGEFAQGHAKGTRNIPLGELKAQLGTLRKDKPVLTCCASGARSAMAAGILRKAGFMEVHNAGRWTAVQ